MGEHRRCEIHGTVLTAEGACVLCERRARTEPTKSGRTMTWLLTGVVGAAIASAVGYRIHLALADRRVVAAAAVEPDPTAATPSAPEAVPGPAAARPGMFGDSPTATAATIEAPSPSAPRAEPAGAEARREHERRVAEAERAVQIDLYGEGWCPSCRKARAWLDSEAISYTYRDTSNAVNKHTMRALNPNSTIPTIDIEGQVVVGFNPSAVRASIRRAAEARLEKRQP